MNNHIYWVGIKESEIRGLTEIFQGSITIFGTGKRGNLAYDKYCSKRYNYNKDIPGYPEFLRDKTAQILMTDPDAQFLFYDSWDAYDCCRNILNHIIGLYPEKLIKQLNDKLFVKNYFSQKVNLIPYFIQAGKDCTLQHFKQIFPGKDSFVVQAGFSCGGMATFLLNEQNEEKQRVFFEAENMYSVTPYSQNNISVNIHTVIYDEEMVLFPASIQIIDSSNDRFLYVGADFAAYGTIPFRMREQVDIQARAVGESLRALGYRGVCGIDFIISGEEVYFMEINPRFQSSTFLLNRCLLKEGFPSVQQYHIEAQLCPSSKETRNLKELDIPFSFYQYSYHENNVDFVHSIYKISPSCPEVTDLYDDGLDWNTYLEDDTYLFRLVFNTNVVSIAPDGSVRLHPAISPRDINVTGQYSEDALIILKIMLFNHGIRICDNARQFLIEHGGIKFEEFDAINLTLYNHVRISAPYHARFTEMSPFSICLAENSKYTYLAFYDKNICNVQVAPSDPWYYRKTVSGVSYSELCYMSTDRLRINFHSGCYLKQDHKGCRFCDVEGGKYFNTFSDLQEVIQMYNTKAELKHFLVGGGSDIVESDFSYVLKLVKYIYTETQKPIYLMTMPPKDVEILAHLKDAGVTEVAFNIEIYSRSRAIEMMPGKGKISLEHYKTILERSVELWGKCGQVRSALIVGLDTPHSLLDGVQWLCEMGVSPILSPFRPYRHTALETYIPASDTELYTIYKKAALICNQYGLTLGPTCPDCEDNTIKITL